MSNTRLKESSKGGRKTPHATGPGSTSTEATGEASGLDATMLQSMMDTLRSDIFGKIDDLSTGLRSEIASVRQELKSSIEPLQRTVEAHAVTVCDLERSASDHSGRIVELEATVSMLTKLVWRTNMRILKQDPAEIILGCLVYRREWRDPGQPTSSPSCCGTCSD